MLDEDGVLKVGGRLTQSNLDHEQMHPIILPANHRITSIIIWNAHVNDGHFKTERLVHHLLKRYWILSARRVIKHQVNKCIPCKRQDAKIMKANRKSSELSSEEINNALKMCIRRAQDIEFAEEKRNLQKKMTVFEHSKIKSLHPVSYTHLTLPTNREV